MKKIYRYENREKMPRKRKHGMVPDEIIKSATGESLVVQKQSLEKFAEPSEDKIHLRLYSDGVSLASQGIMWDKLFSRH